MTQLGLDTSEAPRLNVEAGSPPQTRRRSDVGRRGASEASRKQRMRDRIEAHYRGLFPSAKRISVNVSHSNGPVVEVWREGGADVYLPPARLWMGVE